jgi:DNA-binding beta-propeller fold protein YncE
MMRHALLAGVALAVTTSTLAAQSYKTQKYDIGGEGGFDYLSVDATGRVFVSRGTHVMVVDGATGKVLGDIKDTPRVHGIAFVPSAGVGFTTNAGDSSSTMFDLKTLAPKQRIKAGKDGLDGIMYDDATGKILTINHSKPVGTAVVIDPKSAAVVATIQLSGKAPEGGVSDGKGRIFINLEDRNAIDVVDTKTWTVVDTWKIDPCDGPTGIAMDRATNRVFSGCSKTSVIVDATTGRVVAQIANGDGVDALGWDQSQKLMYIPAGASGNVTIVHEDSPSTFTVVETVPTMRGARTVTVDPTRHIAYVFTPEYGPSTPAATPGGRATRGPVTAAWLITIHK